MKSNIVARASFDSISNSCDRVDPVIGGGAWCHADHFRGDSRPCRGCEYGETNWRMSRGDIPMPDPNDIPYLTWFDEKGNEVEPTPRKTAEKGTSGDPITVQLCKNCEHHRVENPDEPLYHQRHRCEQLQEDCYELRDKATCPEFRDTEIPKKEN